MNQIEQINQNEQIGSYYVKLVRTTQTKSYLLPSTMSIQEFFRVIKINIMDDFGYNSIDDFELVLAGQQISGIRYAEDVPAIDIPNLNGTLYSNYRNSEAFYIRPLIIVTEPTVTEPYVMLNE